MRSDTKLSFLRTKYKLDSITTETGSSQPSKFRRNFEIKNLDHAIQNCQELEKCLEESIEYVRLLNLKYNSCYWLTDSYQDYLSDVAKEEPKTDNKRRNSFHVSNRMRPFLAESTPVNKRKNYSLIAPPIMSTSLPAPSSVKLHRNVRDINRSSSEMNLKLVKIKWDVESLLHSLENTIKVNSKKNAYHLKQRSRLKLDYSIERKICCCCY